MGEQKGLTMTKQENSKEAVISLENLTELMDLSGQVSALALSWYGTIRVREGMALMQISNQIAEVAGVLTEQAGYTIDEVTAPLWGSPSAEALSAA